MKKQADNTDFKAVEFQRERRQAMTKLMHDDPAAFEKQLEQVKKKYAKQFKTKKKKAA